jgi:hypothetical protein
MATKITSVHRRELISRGQNFHFPLNVSDLPRRPSEDGVSDAGESSEEEPLSALRRGAWFGFWRNS